MEGGNYNEDDDIANFVKEQTKKESNMSITGLAAGIQPSEELKFDTDDYGYNVET